MAGQAVTTECKDGDDAIETEGARTHLGSPCVLTHTQVSSVQLLSHVRLFATS